MLKIVSITHDLHQHSFLSTCTKDPEMVPERMLLSAIENGYDTICVTDHVWDSLVTGSIDRWYVPQNIEHIKQSLPLPSAQGVRFCFGCETEYCGGNKLGLHRSSFDLFDFILIPVNHFHFGFVRPLSIDTPELIAELMLTRLEELQQLDLPWKKIGIAHFTCRLTYDKGSIEDVLVFMPDDRLLKIFSTFARYGAGIELSASIAKSNWEQYPDIILRPFKLAKEAGCKFYFASDAHSVSGLFMKERLQPVIDALTLSEDDIYKIPMR